MPDAEEIHSKYGDDGRDVSRRRFLQLMAAGAAGFTIVACAPGTEVPGSSEAGEDETSAGAENGAPAEGEVAVLSVGWSGAPANLDPLTASADTEIALLNAVYDYLIDTNASNELVPRLATDWEVSDDGLAYTLTIAENVTFHSGDPLTIDDIIWTYDRLRDPEAGATTDLFANVEAIEAGEGNTVVFRLSQPNPDFLYNLTDNHAVILQANAENIGSEFNGTGPFSLESYTAEDRASLVANPNYFRGAPAVGRLEFIYFGDNEAAVNALRGGIIDAVLRIDNATFVTLAEDASFNAVDVPTNGHDLVRLRADREPGSDPLVREAFKLATDRQAIFDRLQFGYGAIGQDHPIGPLYAAYYAPDIEPVQYDPERARELLAEAGYEDGLDMTLYVPNAPGRPALAEVLASQWAEAGINVTIEVQEEAVYYGDEGWLEVDLGITPWGSRPVPQLYLDLAYQCGAQWNEAHYCNDELDALIATTATTLDEAERTEAYREIQRILVEDGPVIIPYFFASLGVFSNAVENVELHPFPGRTNFHEASLGG
ncbi:MAG TPA: ABC transporter substrate-binding protein [Aggregatilineales bacterium]|nr:ABC transporter substrate-binding protein [Aggregatilineales bacterium]